MALNESVLTGTPAVRDEVDTDFAKQCCVVDTMDFVHKMFPVPSDTISAVFARLKTSGIYNAGRWKDFPPEKARVKEKVLCAPFIQAANAIREATESVVDGANNDLLGVAGWVDYHSQVSKASDPDAAPIRPDCLLGHNVSKFKGIAYASKTEQTAQDGRDTMSTRRKKEALQASVWWLQIICAIEMKRNDSQTGMDVVKQLIRYLRRILCEQLDRRFVFGMTLGPNRMTVWLHDRSGVLGTTESFNIHEDPCSFIRVIAAFSVLSMEQLGYDTQMILYASPTNIVPTYMLNDEAARHYLTTANTEKQWLIRTNGEEQYLTVKVLSVSRAYVVQSRASLVWAVVPFNGGKVSSTKVHVLKQSWQPEKTDSEHDMLTKVKNAAAKTEMNVAAKAKYSEKDFIGEVQLEEIISVGGVPDITGSLIRRHLDVRVSTSSSTVSKRPRDEDTESYLHVNVTDDDIISIVPSLNTSSPPISRIHTRLLLSTYGWPLECFKTLKEAVCGIRDAVGGHEYVYVNGLLHRDISPSNIILAWCDGDDGTTGLGTKGCLIDFDRGKYGKLNEPILQVPANFPALDPEDAAPPSHFARRYRQLSLPPIVANVQIASSEAVPPYYVDEYIIRAWTHFSKFAITGIGHEVDPSLLRWTKVLRRFSFKFLPSERQARSRTGTPPYTSGEILTNTRYDSKTSVFHDAIHDIESFFWVVIHICLTRSGPGQCREELTGDSEDHKALHFLIYCFFDGPPTVLGPNKHLLFARPDDFETYIIPNFHPYFDELKPFMQEWFSLLVLAYTHVEGYEYYNIHNRVVDILDRALASMTPEELDCDVGRKAVIEERRDTLHQLIDNRNGAGGGIGVAQSFDRTSPPVQRTGTADLYDNTVNRSSPPSPSPAPKKGKVRH